MVLLYLYLLRRSTPFMIVYGLIFFVGSPFWIYGGLYGSGGSFNYLIYSAGNSIGTPMFSIAALLAAVTHFKFLTSRAEGDRLFALPMSKAQLFFTHFAAGFSGLLISYIALGNPIFILLRKQFAEMRGEDRRELIRNLFTLFGIRGLILLAVFAFAVFLCVNIGKVFDICLYFFLLPYLLLVAAVGLPDALNGNMLGIAGTGGFGGSALARVILLLSNYQGFGEGSHYLILIAAYGVFAAGFTALAFRLFAVRKRERAGSPFCFAYLKIVLAVFVSLFLGFLTVLVFMREYFTMSDFPVTAILFLAASAAIYAGALAIARRSFRIFGREWIFYPLPVALYAVLIVYFATGAFGAVTRVPEAGEIASVTVGLESSYNAEESSGLPEAGVRGLNLEWLKNYTREDKYGLNRFKEFSDPEGVRAAREFHLGLLRRYEKYEYSQKKLDEATREEYADASGLSDQEMREYLAKGPRSAYAPRIVYRLKNGKTLSRQYGLIPKLWIDEHYDRLEQLDASPAEEGGEMRGRLSQFLDTYLPGGVPQIELIPAAPMEHPEWRNITLSEAQFKRLVLAIYDDEAKLTAPADYNGGDYGAIRMLYSGSMPPGLFQESVIIKKSFRNTIRVLEDFGMEIPQEAQYVEGMGVDIFSARFLPQGTQLGSVERDGAFEGVFKAKLGGAYDEIWDSPVARSIHKEDEIRMIFKDISHTGVLEDTGLIVRMYYPARGYSDVYYLAPGTPANLRLRERFSFEEDFNPGP